VSNKISGISNNLRDNKQIGGGGIMNPSQRVVTSGDDHENRAGPHKDKPS
jgi:hypothetical protein